MSDDDINWNGVSPEMAKQILQQGETFLSAQWQAAIAADQRAVTTASIFIAIAVAAVAGTLSGWSLSAGFTASFAMIVGAFLCFWSARPSEFYAPGNHPDQWWDCRNADLTTAIGGETENYQARINRNSELLGQNGRLFMWGIYCAVASPVVAIMVFAGITFCPL